MCKGVLQVVISHDEKGQILCVLSPERDVKTKFSIVCSTKQAIENVKHE
jgi:hypothetical protein